MHDMECLSVALRVAKHHCQALSKLVEAITGLPTIPVVATSASSNVSKQVLCQTLWMAFFLGKHLRAMLHMDATYYAVSIGCKWSKSSKPDGVPVTSEWSTYLRETSNYFVFFCF